MSESSAHYIQPTAKTYNSQGLSLSYLDWGNADKPPLILLHGNMDHAHSWDWVARELCEDWHIIVPDLRGHGDSEWSPNGAYLPSYYLQDIADLIDHLGFESLNIIAHSFGGNCASKYAALYPERVKKLVLVDAMGPSKMALEKWRETGIVTRTREWLEKRQAVSTPPRYFDSIEAAAARLVKNNPLLTQKQAEHLAEHGTRRHEQGYLWKHDPAVSNFTPDDFAIHLSEYWQAITAPVLSCWGPKGWTSDPSNDGSAEYFQQIRPLTFANSGHWIHHNETEAFVAAVKTFLS